MTFTITTKTHGEVNGGVYLASQSKFTAFIDVNEISKLQFV